MGFLDHLSLSNSPRPLYYLRYIVKGSPVIFTQDVLPQISGNPGTTHGGWSQATHVTTEVKPKSKAPTIESTLIPLEFRIERTKLREEKPLAPSAKPPTIQKAISSYGCPAVN